MNVYDFVVQDRQGDDAALSQYKGKVLLIVNTATHCGLTPQYEQLEALYQKYKNRGFEILDFPCNQFLSQAPENDADIHSFCQLTYGTSFPRYSKIEVNGKNAAPLFKYLKEQIASEQEDAEAKNLKERLLQLGQHIIGSEIKWNFTKFLVNNEGQVIARFPPTFKPKNLENEIEKLL